MKKYKKMIMVVAVLSLFLGTIKPIMICSSQEAQIADGVYIIPVTLWNASVDQPSMGNNALQQTGKLEVKDGKGKLYVKFMQMTFSGMAGYLSAFDLLEDISFNEFHYPEDYRLIPGTEISVYSEVDEFNGPDSTDVNCAGKMYPKVISMPVSLVEENIWAHVYVPVMGSLGFGDQICRVHINIDGITPITEEEAERWREDEKSDGTPVETQDPGKTPGASIFNTEKPAETPDNSPVNTEKAVDRSELYVWICKAQELLKQTEQYTETSLMNLQGVLTNAQKAYDAGTTQTVIDGQVILLQEAVNALVEKSQEQLDKDNLKDGKYYVHMYLWHATSNKASMGDPALNHEALLTVSDGSYQIDLSTRTMTVGTITACLQSLQIKQTDGSYVYADITERNNPNGQPSIFHFTLPVKEEYVDVLIDPKVEVMGKDPLPARLKINWETLKSANSNATVNTLQTENPATATSAAIKITDSKTKMKFQAGENVMPSDAVYQFKRIRSGGVYKRAAALWKSAAAFRVYQISATSGGETVQPSGMVKISIPVPKGYVISGTTVSRLEGKSKILMSGTCKKGYYIFSTNRLGNFVISTSALKSSTGKNKTGTSSVKQNTPTPLGKGASQFNLADRQLPGDTSENGVEENMAAENGVENEVEPFSENSNALYSLGQQIQELKQLQEQQMDESDDGQQQFVMILLAMSVLVSGILAVVTLVAGLQIWRKKS